MKKLIPILLIIAILLSGCKNDADASDNWDLTIYESATHLDTSTDEARDAICATYTNVAAQMWSYEAGDWQLTIIQNMDFVTGIYVEDKTYVVSADNIDDLKSALKQYDCYKQINSILGNSPYNYVAHSEVVSPDETGWGTRVVYDYELDWPENATSTSYSWQTDDVTFQVSQYGKVEEDTDAELQGMINDMLEQNIEGIIIWYYETEKYQALAWLYHDRYDISLARYDSRGSLYLTLAQQTNISKAQSLADRYDMREAIDALFTSEPYFRN